ncbi:MAG: glycosyltransferase family 2 protein [Anaerolineaceae bacterium]|nr:glycosyltransferase family 2 protein [Anaerolineaceae bacterium]
MEPSITVVIPLYNKEKSIIRAINSVLNQTEQNFELIVVNDGSTDHSATVVENLNAGDKVRLVNQENGGECAARNRGIKEANNALIAFLDADDEWMPGFLEAILALQAQFPEAEVFGTSYYKQDDHGNLFLPRVGIDFGAGWKGIIPNFFDAFSMNNQICASSIAATKAILNKVGGFPIGVKYGGDIDTFIRLSTVCKIAYDNRPLSKVYLDAENRVSVLTHDPSEEFHSLRTVQHLLDSGALPESLRQSAFEYLVRKQLKHARNYLVFGKNKNAKMLLKSSKGTKKYTANWYWLSFWASIPPILYVPVLNMRRALRKKLSK